jgi:hypothetical protein
MKHGRDWMAVAKIVAGRNSEQCCKRWINTVDPANHGKKPGKWTLEVDGKLEKAVMKHGNDWVEVAKLVPGRTGRQ